MKKLLLLLLAFAPLFLAAPAHAQLNSTPPGCPYISSASCSIPVYPAGSPYALNQLVTGSDGNIYISQVGANVADPASATECGVNWKLWAVNVVTTTVNIPAKCPALSNMVAFENSISAMSIFSNIVNQLAAGTYALGTTNINLNNTFGAQISLIGDAVTPANVVITYSGINGTPNLVNHAALELTLGHSYGTINGITFTGPGSGGGNYGNSCALLAEGPGNVTFGPNIFVTASYCGVQARDFARITASGIDVNGGGDGGIWAYNAFVQAIGASVHGVSNGNCSCGFLADNHAYMTIDGSFSYSNGYGAGLYTNSVMRVNGTTIGAATFGHNSSGTALLNTSASVRLFNSLPTNLEGVANYFDANKLSATFTNYIQNSTITDIGGGTEYAFLSGGNSTNLAICNGAAVASAFPCGYYGANKAGQKAYSGDAASGNNILPQAYLQSSTGGSGTATGVSLGTNGHLGMYMSGTDQSTTWIATLTAPSINVSGLTASLPVCTDSSKNLTSTCPAGDLPILIGTTGSIGGGVLIAGACTSGTVAVTSSTTAMSVVATPVTYPGDGVTWSGYVSTAGTVTVKVCAIVGLTPGASNYNVRVIQ